MPSCSSREMRLRSASCAPMTRDSSDSPESAPSLRGHVPEVDEVARHHVEVAQAPVQAPHQAHVHGFVPVAHGAERAQERTHHAPAFRERQRAEAVEVFGEHDGIGRVFARVDLRVDVHEHHGLAGLDHDATDAVPRSQHVAPVALARGARAVYPLEGRADERRQPDGHEVEAVDLLELLDRVRVPFALSRKLRFGEIRSPHVAPSFPRPLLQPPIIPHSCGICTRLCRATGAIPQAGEGLPRTSQRRRGNLPALRPCPPCSRRAHLPATACQPLRGEAGGRIRHRHGALLRTEYRTSPNRSLRDGAPC